MSIKVVAYFLILTIVSCKSKNEEKKEVAPEANVVKQQFALPEQILQSSASFWNYYYNNVKLTYNFKGFDENKKELTQKDFFTKLLTKEYFPLRMDGGDNGYTYMLYKFKNSEQQKYYTDIAYLLDENYANFLREKQPMPEFSFTDLQNSVFTNKSLLGKVVVYKTWFINCVPCVQEMPELNKLVEKYQNNSNVLFISLALDKKEKLKQFLLKTKFDYKVVPEQEKYITEKMEFMSYPKHFIVNKLGNIVAITSDNKILESIIEAELKK